MECCQWTKSTWYGLRASKLEPGYMFGVQLPWSGVEGWGFEARVLRGGQRGVCGAFHKGSRKAREFYKSWARESRHVEIWTL